MRTEGRQGEKTEVSIDGSHLFQKRRRESEIGRSNTGLSAESCVWLWGMETTLDALEVVTNMVVP